MIGNIQTSELVSAGNVRSDVDTGLAPSIREHGILEPLSVYRLGDAWVVQDGHRRLAGAVEAGLTEIPCKEVPAPTDEAKRIIAQYVINQHRKSLSYLDQASQYARLINEFGYKQKDVARELGVSEATVSLALTALRAHPKIQEALLSGRISHSAAELVISLPVEEQAEIADQVIVAKTVTKIRDVVQTHKKKTTTTVQAKVDYREVDPLEEMAVDGMEEALKNLQLADMAIISDPDLRVRAATALGEILRLVERLYSYTMEPSEVAEYGYELEDA